MASLYGKGCFSLIFISLKTLNAQRRMLIIFRPSLCGLHIKPEDVLERLLVPARVDRSEYVSDKMKT